MNIDTYEHEERISIRMDSGMSESAAIAMTNADDLLKRVSVMAQHQREHAAPSLLRAPSREPMITAKDKAAGQ